MIGNDVCYKKCRHLSEHNWPAYGVQACRRNKTNGRQRSFNVTALTQCPQVQWVYLLLQTWAKMSPTCIILENQLVDSGVNKRRQKIAFVLYFFTSHPRHLACANIFQKKLFSEAWKDHDVHHALTLAQSREKVVVIYLRIRKFRLRDCLVTRQYHPAVMR